MIRGIFGRTGGGKTLTLVKELIKTLLETERTVVTNLEELVLPRLDQYLQERREAEAKKHPARAKPPVDLAKRLVVIKKSETRYFYRWRSGGLILPVVVDKDRNGKFIGLDAFNVMMEAYFEPCYSKREHAVGVDYFITEAHRYFPARLFQEFGEPVKFYATQHRHLNDNFWLESQFPGQIDLNFRELAVEWYHVRNHGREVMGMFRQRSVFSFRMYYELPKGKLPPSDDKGEFKLDVAGVASCYKTRGAISGLADSSPEDQPKSKKLPFWMLPVGVVMLIVLAGVGLTFLPKLTQKGLEVAMGSMNKSAQAGLSATMGAKASSGPASSPVSSNPSSASSVPAYGAKASTDLWVTGVCSKGHVLFVQMSDGTRRWLNQNFLPQSDAISMTTPSYVVLDGIKMYVRPSARPASVSPSVGPGPSFVDRPADARDIALPRGDKDPGVVK